MFKKPAASVPYDVEFDIQRDITFNPKLIIMQCPQCGTLRATPHVQLIHAIREAHRVGCENGFVVIAASAA